MKTAFLEATFNYPPPRAVGAFPPPPGQPVIDVAGGGKQQFLVMSWRVELEQPGSRYWDALTIDADNLDCSVTAWGRIIRKDGCVGSREDDRVMAWRDPRVPPEVRAALLLTLRAEGARHAHNAAAQIRYLDHLEASGEHRGA